VIAALSEGGLDRREGPVNRDVALLADALWPVLAALGGHPPDPARFPWAGDI
jgi:beta-lactamase class A